MRELQSAESLHLQYRMIAEAEAQIYTDLKTTFPMRSFPKHSARVWRYAVLAEAWGAIATKLSPTKRDYLNQWRTGL